MDLYEQYLIDNPQPVGQTNDRREKNRKNRLRKAVNRAKILQEESIDGLSKDQAKQRLEERAEEQVAGMSGIGYFVLKAVLAWLIGKLLEAKFGNNEEN